MNNDSPFPPTQASFHLSKDSSGDLTCGWLHDVRQAVAAAEEAEAALSYSSDCGSESDRKQAGAYYTPADVAGHFWAIFFDRAKIESDQDVRQVVADQLFIEPSVGAGALFFSLLESFIARGLSPSSLSEIKVDLIDINDRALQFVGHQIGKLESNWNVTFSKVRLLNSDFRHYELPGDAGAPIFFGNPPFVTNERGVSRWKNSYADFVERSLILSPDPAHLQYILPLSITFSRDYRDLRRTLRQSHLEISVSSYDNIPDTLFKSGKPKNTNTNKANSQRCSVLTAIPSDVPSVFSTKLHRWSRTGRTEFLSTVPKYEDVSGYHLDDQILRPASSQLANYLQAGSMTDALEYLTSGTERYRLLIGAVARNFIGFREEDDRGCNILGFASEDAFLTALGILSSDLFLEYWLSVGDGFHITKSTVLNFPISKRAAEAVRGHHQDIREFWRNRDFYKKVKLNNGKETTSFDFSAVGPKLLDIT